MGMPRFFRSEVRHIGLSVAVLTVALSGIGFRPPSEVLDRVVIVVIPLVVGFLAHEVAHKAVAQRYGILSVYRAWDFGLVLALLAGLLSGGRFVFAAPGAVVLLAPFLTLEQSARISLAGPLTNILVAGVFFLLSAFGGILGPLGSLGSYINLWLACFNLMPFPPLDGSKVFAWNPKVWAAVEIPLLVIVVSIY
jgi:Zn-dependent protease